MSANVPSSADILAQMKEKVLRRATTSGQTLTDIPGFSLHRHEGRSCCHATVLTPSFGVMVQGRKQALIGAAPYTYGEGQCLITGMNMPDTFTILDASAERPFLAAGLELDRRLLMQLAASVPPPSATPENFHCVTVATAEVETLQAMLRLLNLLDTPEQIPVLAPLIIQEIHYRLLLSPQGEALRRLNTLGTPCCQIFQAVSTLKENFKEPLHIEDLARKVGMGTSTFHRHFKEVTSLSPLQYHKRLRLLEARRLMLTESMDATSTADAVGYESVTQFNREYKRLFGEPPFRDVHRLLAAQLSSSAH